MTAPNLTFYDILGVSREASPGEIKAAWREATDRFEPGSSPGQFRMYNEAADVLLDPDRRAAYDQELARFETPATPVAETSQAPAAAPMAEPVLQRTEPRPGPAVAQEESEPPARRSGVWAAVVASLAAANVVVLVALVVLVIVTFAGALWTGLDLHKDAAVADARTQAPPAAERAVTALFSYDYRDLDSDRSRAQGYLTDHFAKTYLRNFDALKKQKDGTPGLAVQTKAVVKASVQSSGVVDAESDVARVLVFVDLTSRKGSGAPQIFQNRVAMTMVKQGDKWLVDNVNSY